MTKSGYGVAAAPTNTTVDKTPSVVHQVHHQMALTTMKKSRDFWRKKPSLGQIALMNSKLFLLILIAKSWKFSRPRLPRKPVVKKDLSQVWPLMQFFVRSTNFVQTVIDRLCLVFINSISRGLELREAVETILVFKEKVMTVS